MKCPVCEKQIENTVQKCPNCGFEDLRTEFINENELEMWRTYVVYPCRFAYETSVAQTKELQRKFSKEISALKKAQKELQESSSDFLNNDTNSSSPTFKKLALSKKDGWVTKGNITYKSFYECKYSRYTACEISNMIITTIGNKMTADFFVKKSFDEDGSESTFTTTFKWKLKDDFGIVVADGSWSNNKLQVGDVTKASISVSGIDPSTKYVLELVNA